MNEMQVKSMTFDRGPEQSEAAKSRIQACAFIIAAVFAGCLCICFAVSGFSGSEKSREAGLEFQINPNNAPQASLVRLPGIGTGRAAAIVAYRENFRRENGGKAAFQSCADLQKVKGIGPKTAANMCEWLKFE